jgi:phosphatidate cytidylyltransferase
MSSNTIQRVLSALVLVLIVVACVYFGKVPTLVLIGLASLIAIDEIYTNFFERKRLSYRYFISQLICVVPYIYFNFLDVSPAYSTIVVNAAVSMNIILIVYLFNVEMESDIAVTIGKKYPFLAGVIIGLPLLATASLFQYTMWIELFVVMLVLNFSMDSGAWFFGKKFGKRKLWEAVSPKKTVEGLIGGVITAALLGGLTWYFLFEKISLLQIFTFMLLGVMSQVGDLIQSKIKRQFGIKDSSSLIPGHGGVYDRIDSVIFLAPFYAVAVRLFYFSN